jgi:hypothetical protein
LERRSELARHDVLPFSRPHLKIGRATRLTITRAPL